MKEERIPLENITGRETEGLSDLEILFTLPDPDQDEGEDDDSWQPCDNCDLPDACADFGCAIKNGVRKNYPIDGVF